MSKNSFEDDYINQPELCEYILKQINTSAIYSFDDWSYAKLISKAIDGDDENLNLISTAIHPSTYNMVLHGVVIDIKPKNEDIGNGKYRITLVDDNTFERYGSTVQENLFSEVKIVAAADGEYTIGAVDKIEPGTRVYLYLGLIEAFGKCPDVLFSTVFDIAAISESGRTFVGADGKFCSESEFLKAYSRRRETFIKSVNAQKEELI